MNFTVHVFAVLCLQCKCIYDSYQLASKVSKSSQTYKYDQLRLNKWALKPAIFIVSIPYSA